MLKVLVGEAFFPRERAPVRFTGHLQSLKGNCIRKNIASLERKGLIEKISLDSETSMGRKWDEKTTHTQEKEG